MATDIVIPNVGESVTSGMVAQWVKAEGSYVNRDETIMELETDKITMEIPAPASGVLTHGAAEGDEVDVGASVGSIDESAEAPAGGDAPAPEPKKAEAEPKPTPASTPAAQPAASGGGAATAVAEMPAPSSNGSVHATPLARKLAEELSVDLASVTGTGAGHRVREQDVIAAAQAAKSAPKATAAPAAAAPAGARGVTREKMSPLRQRIATRLVDAQQTAAMLTTFNEVDMGPVMELRKKHKEAFGKKHDVNLGFMSFFIKAATSALRAYPMVNAFIVEENGSPAVEKHDYQDIAIAVASPKGLVVPVLRNCAQMSFADVESGVKDFAVRAKEGKLALDEMQGGTFTITNGGIFGSLMSTPILNPPQSAILGMHTIKQRPAEDINNPGQLSLRPMMYLALSYDHRIIDGAEAVQFLVHIKDSIEDPARLLLDL